MAESMIDAELFGKHRVQRIAPRIPAASVKTYHIRAPLERNFRKATCAEVECPQWRDGWDTALDESIPEQHHLANYIRSFSGRAFVEIRNESGQTVFAFKAGQMCFDAESHVISLEREPLYVVTGGDWRGNPRGEGRVHVNGDEWVEDFGEHQDKLATRLDQG